MKANLISLFSTKGGVGKTFMAVNLAVSLAQEGKKVILVDFDLQAAQDMSRMIDVTAQYSMYDISAIIDKIKELGNIKNYITLVPSAGIDFLPAVTRPKQASHIIIERVDMVMNMLIEQYDFIILDGGKAFTDSLIAAFNCSNLILFVVTPDIISVYETRWGLDVLQSLHFPLNMVKLVLNRSESKSALSMQEISLALPYEVLAHIPSEGKIVGLALNRGIPVVIDSPACRVSQSIKKLAQVLIKRNDIYIEHQELKQMRAQSKEKMPGAGTFWDTMGLTELEKKMDVLTEEDEVIKLKRHIHQRLIEELDLKRLDLEIITNSQKAKELREKADKIVTNLLSEETGAFLSSFEVRERIVKEICDEALALGPLEDFLKDNDITDIMVNGKDQVYIERHGRLEMTTKKFISNDQVRIIIERIIAPLGRRLDESVPMVDSRLPDGSRVNAIIPPLALSGPVLTIRKFSREHYTIADLISRFGSLDGNMAEFLKACVISRINLIVSGGTGSGKTTFLNILSEFVPSTERIITIEDAAELRLTQEHWIRLESRPHNIEGKGAITVRDLFRNTLRMRPDRIIVGECRGGEVLDMLQAMNTGHDGSMTTVHANSTQDVLTRLDSMILMSGVELPLRAIREMIASAVDLIVHTARLPDGTRKVIQISEVVGMLDDTHINLKDLFVFKQTGIDRNNNNKVIGHFQATGIIPTFYDDIVTRGVELPREIFKP
ncbi:MAG: ATPase, T2SS/T4P/T4SS family [Candidatus Omnitrophica bacterium]|nr:ATPase, T2SS/T4P/T4SS family [Candidatus Omnitrophota bacterium]MDD5351569.1 ATPase, T2SS/T4P/T4SS family [Candidatus Omnitrophota bacterium]MDD5551004.1 ATPase, T2SS/T4P/T4SS family [Candidatus Omnitrophota bacterium]